MNRSHHFHNQLAHNHQFQCIFLVIIIIVVNIIVGIIVVFINLICPSLRSLGSSSYTYHNLHLIFDKQTFSSFVPVKIKPLLCVLNPLKTKITRCVYFFVTHLPILIMIIIMCSAKPPLISKSPERTTQFVVVDSFI